MIGPKNVDVVAEKTAEILVVDDEPINRELVEDMLRSENFTIRHAADGHAALKAIAMGSADLVILDVMMPGLDGIETCRRIRNDLKKLDLPVIFATALDDRDSRIRAKEVGADDFLTKPLDGTELKVRVRNLLAAKGYHELKAKQSALLEMELERTRHQLVRLDRMAMLGTLAAGVGHELNNIAAVLHSLLFSVRESALDGKGPDAEILTDLDTVDKHLTMHAKQLLNLGRPGSDKSEPLNLNDLIQSTLAMLHVAGRTKLVKVETEFSASPTMVEVNGTRIEQVLVNLVGNAADALEALRNRPGRIWVRVQPGNRPGRVVCAIEDNGTGIAKDSLPHIFEPYFTTKPPGKGTGLGLPVVRQIVESYGGKLTVESTVGHGSVFSFDLPEACRA